MLTELLFPPICPTCGKVMGEGERFVCNNCRWNAPLTGFHTRVDNPVVQKFWGIVPIVQGCAFLHYVEGNGFRDMIHDFKYHGMWRYALEAGRWFGGELLRGGLYADVDLVVPVPLHVRKLLRRGYNQSDYIARGIAESLGVACDCHAVRRRRHNPSQAQKRYHERWENVKELFRVVHPERLSGRHILLVDDVLTSGATITSCAEAIVESVPNCRLSIATLATPIEPIF